MAGANGAAPVAMALGLGAVIAICGVWDVLITYSVVEGRTVSAVLHEWSVRLPVLPLLTGVLLGHLFWPPRIP